jgi:hypothetical protein
MNGVKNILLIQLFSNGDCLYATTLAVQIKKDYPGCNLQWLIFDAYRQILKENPYVDEIVTIDRIEKESADALYKRTVFFAKQRVAEKKSDTWFFPQLISDNLSFYDGCLRRSLLRSYPGPVTVDKKAVLVLNQAEKDKAHDFFSVNNIAAYKNVVLFETSPLSGQVALSDDDVVNIAGDIASIPNTCVILSSYKAYNVQNKAVFNGNSLTIRETSAFSHFCTLLLGCSSGITWSTVTTGGRQLPMIQLLNPDAYYFNPPSADFAYSGLGDNEVVELYRFNVADVCSVVRCAITEGISGAKKNFNQVQKNQFKMHRGIIHNFLKRGKFLLIFRFLRVNFRQNGFNLKMISQIIKGFFFFPIQVIKDAIEKKA